MPRCAQAAHIRVPPVSPQCYLSTRAGHGEADPRDLLFRLGDKGPDIAWTITNLGSTQAEVIVLDAYTGNQVTSRVLHPHATVVDKLSLDQFFGWYDLIVTAGGDPTFKYRTAGHVETGADSFSDPALRGSCCSQGLMGLQTR